MMPATTPVPAKKAAVKMSMKMKGFSAYASAGGNPE